MSFQRLKKDFETMQKDPPPLCTAGPTGDNFHIWEAIIMGPPKSPYQGGVFKMRIDFPNDYPFKPPKVTFLTKIYHPNIGPDSGSTCLDIIKDKWKVVYGVSQILVAVCGLLDEPNALSPLNREAAELYQKNRQAYNRKAAEMTRQYAI
uniref:E2 ubiquitin-conjugating enzyme n=1 Tax=Panagrolaimus davidi TaxID=227884 RepID=A0A914QQ04_9BILA